jgi:hypothetical protein
MHGHLSAFFSGERLISPPPARDSILDDEGSIANDSTDVIALINK